MHLYEQRERKKYRIQFFAVILICAVLVVSLFALSKISQVSTQEEMDLLYRSIDQAVVNCYAIEGRYPESIDYIIEHYGVILDEDKYIIDYEIFASNVKPSVHILVKGEQ